MFRFKHGLLIAAWLGLVACGEATDSAGHNQPATSLGDTPGDANAAAVTYQRTCSSCHGDKAQGDPAQQAPALAGQARDYLQRQLRNFADGLRGNDPADTQGRQMMAIAVGFSAAQRSQLASYISTLPAANNVAVALYTASDRYKNGRNYYQSYCGSCHGYTAGGNAQLHAPKLSGLDATYLARQYQNFAQGLRGQHSDDQYGRQMRAIAVSFSDPVRLDDVIAYIGSIK